MSTDGHKPYYQLTADEVLAELRTTAAGLPQSEAADRRRHLGENRLILHPWPAAWQLLLTRFKNPLVLLLAAAAGIAVYARDGETAAFLVIVALANAGVGFAQEYRPRQLSAVLAKLVPKQTKVLRRGRVQAIESRKLVPGDIIYLKTGDQIPADARILEEDGLTTNDFELTGASQPTRKFAYALTTEVPFGSQNNLVYLGATVVRGTGRAVVTATSMNTELGRLASASQTAPAGLSPLQREVRKLTGRLVNGIALLAVVAIIIGLQANLGTKTALLFAVSLVAIIPAGLQIEIGLILTQAAGWLTRVGGSAKRLSAIDTLGAASVLLTDKTAALTTGELTAHELVIGKTHYRVSGTGYAMNGIINDAKGTPLTGATLKDLHLFFQAGALANSARVLPPDQDHAAWYVSGDPAEGALITLARKAGVDTDGLTAHFRERQRYTFDAVRQRTASVRTVDGQPYIFVQGVPEAVLAASTEIWDHGHIRKLTARDRQSLLGYRHEQIVQGKDGLACAYRVLSPSFDPGKHTVEDVEQELIFLGIVLIDDPVIETASETLADLRRAHVNLSIITDETPPAAAATARMASPDGDTPLPVVSSADLSRLTDNQIVGLLAGGGAVFNRISLADRLRLVDLAKQSRQVVAATGQSLHEAPLLQRADAGLSLAAAAADLSDTADIVLPTGRLATVASAIERGRLAWQHAKTAAVSALTDSAAELLLVLGGMAATLIWGIPAALTALQILIINAIIQLLPLGALGGDPAASKLMHIPPRNRHERLVSSNALHRAVGAGSLAAGLVFVNYLLFFARHHLSPAMSPNAAPHLQATTLAFVTLALCQFINSLLARHPANKPFFNRTLWSNNKLLMALALSLLCLGVIVYDPTARAFFGTSPLTFWDWGTAALAALLYIFVRTFLRHTNRYGHRQLFATHHPAKIKKHLRPVN
jgi:Ca2+-transporting ATPase